MRNNSPSFFLTNSVFLSQYSTSSIWVEKKIFSIHKIFPSLAYSTLSRRRFTVRSTCQGAQLNSIFHSYTIDDNVSEFDTQWHLENKCSLSYHNSQVGENKNPSQIPSPLIFISSKKKKITFLALEKIHFLS